MGNERGGMKEEEGRAEPLVSRNVVNGSVTRERPDEAAAPAHRGRLGPALCPGLRGAAGCPLGQPSPLPPRFPEPLALQGVPRNPIAVLPAVVSPSIPLRAWARDFGLVLGSSESRRSACLGPLSRASMRRRGRGPPRQAHRARPLSRRARLAPTQACGYSAASLRRSAVRLGDVKWLIKETQLLVYSSKHSVGSVGLHCNV